MKSNKTSEWRRALFATLGVCALLFISSCKQDGSQQKTSAQSGGSKVGLLLVNHGSRSATWRNALMDLESRVRDRVLASGSIQGIKTAHMEYTEPSIATRLKEFDSLGYTDIIIVPIFLTVSPHTFDDIPTIIGQKEDSHSAEMLKIEKIERYTPKAKTHLCPNLDFSQILKKNVLRRAQDLSKNPSKEGLVLIGYGDETYDKEWGELFDTVADYVKAETGISAHSYGWCGHIAHYNPEKTTEAIHEVLKKKESAVVIPVLVAHDENFQVKIIGTGIQNVKDKSAQVYYKGDSILPDANVEQWVIDISAEFAKKIQSQSSIAGQ